MKPDWSYLPEELLHIVSKKLEEKEDYCFDTIHARSVCRSWRSSFDFPCCLLRPRYSLPKFNPESKDFCTLEKNLLFLFRVKTHAAVAAVLPSKYFLGRIDRDDDDDHHMELTTSPLQCSLKVEVSGCDPLVNMLDCQIIPLGYQYRMMDFDPEERMGYYKGVVFLPLNKEGGEEEGREFVMILNYSKALLVLTSSEMKWKQLENVPDYVCTDLVAFRSRFYATFLNGNIFVIDPFSLEVTPLMPSQPIRSSKNLIPSGSDELFLVENFNPFPEANVIDFNQFVCRVSRLDEEAGKWVEVSELGDRVLFIGHLGNLCCSAKDFRDGCGVSGNSILFTYLGDVTFAYKYGVDTGREDDELNTWRFSREKRVTILNTFPIIPSTCPLVAFRVT